MRQTKNNHENIKRGTNILKIASVFSLLCLIFLTSGYFNPAKAAQSVGKHPQFVDITDIDVTDHAVTIRANGPLTYTLYKASDPFTVILDLEGARLGRHTQRIFSQKQGITEIRPSQVSAPVFLSRLEILLSTPSDVVPEMKDGALVLKVKEQEIALRGAAPSQRSAAKIIDIKFDKNPESVELVLKGDGSMPDPVVKEIKNSVLIDIPNIKMSAILPAKSPPPVKGIKYKTDNEALRFELDVEGKVDVIAFALDDEIIVDIPYKPSSIARAEMPEKEIKDNPEAKAAPPAQPSPVPNAKLISLDFQDADVAAILRLLSDVSGKNIIIHPDVKGKISMKLSNVPWEQALDVVAKTHNLYIVADGNIIRIEPYSVFIASNEGLAKIKEALRKAEPQETRVFTANYVAVDKFKESLEKSKILTKDMGSVSIDSRTRTIIVKDTPTVLDEVGHFLKSIDKPTKQILIESRIVELNTNLARSLGIEWGLKMRPFNWDSAIVGSLPNPIAGGMGAPGLINLPASTGRVADPTSALTVGYLNRKKTFGLDMRLSAIEYSGRGKIISKPKVITGDNQKAKIVQGESIPYGERTTTGGVTEITTKFKDVAITIEVTPQITDDNNILLDVLVNKEDLIEFVNIGGGTSAPRTTKLEGKTNVMIENGETMVIGGIYKKDERQSEERVPGFASIPLVGELFKKRTKEDDVKEFLIFITPKVVQR